MKGGGTVTKSIKRICTVGILVVFLLSTVGVYATWQYAGLPPDPREALLNILMNPFLYKPEEVLPDEKEDSKLGENHLSLIDAILNTNDYGLNETKKPILHTYLSDDGIVYCNQSVQGGNLKHLMIDQVSGSERLYFVITRVSDTVYYTYTMRYSDLSLPVGTRIQVYRTTMEKKDGEWEATGSVAGYAAVNTPGIVSRAIDPDTFSTSQ